MGTLVIVIVLWYGGKLIIKGEGFLTGEAFIYYIVLFYSIINPAKSFTTGLYSVQKGMASIDRVDGLLNTYAYTKEAENLVPADLEIARDEIPFEGNDYFVGTAASIAKPSLTQDDRQITLEANA